MMIELTVTPDIASFLTMMINKSFEIQNSEFFHKDILKQYNVNDISIINEFRTIKLGLWRQSGKTTAIFELLDSIKGKNFLLLANNNMMLKNMKRNLRKYYQDYLDVIMQEKMVHLSNIYTFKNDTSIQGKKFNVIISDGCDFTNEQKEKLMVRYVDLNGPFVFVSLIY